MVNDFAAAKETLWCTKLSMSSTKQTRQVINPNTNMNINYNLTFSRNINLNISPNILFNSLLRPRIS
jgi:hypothetical protein